MGDRPYVVVSCAVSIDGYLDDASGERLLLSNEADLDRVDEVRARCDAILVGAGTIRRDDPRLLVRSPARRATREALGLARSPTRVTITTTGDVAASARFFTAGDTERLVYCASRAVAAARERLATVAATVLDGGDPVDLGTVLADLAGRGIGTVLVEGGGATLTGFLSAGLADELHLAVAPLFVGDSRAPRVVGDGAFPWTAANRARLVEASAIGDVVLARYALSARFDDRFGGTARAPVSFEAPVSFDRRWLLDAIGLSRRCPRSSTAYAVGAIVVDAGGRELARGYSRDTGPHVHAEESALARIPAGTDLSGATVYSSLEPCSARRSHPRTCTELILAAGVRRVVFALREPPVLAECHGAQVLSEAGVEVVEYDDLAGLVREVNAAVLAPGG